MESLFEKFLWNSRFVVIAAVLASLLTSLAMFYMATIDAIVMVSHLGEYADISLSAAERAALRSSTVTHVVEIIDGYLLATVLLIFALGLYELFISEIDIKENGGDNVASNVLVIHSLDDLKNRLAKVILMILIVKFFEHAISMDYTDALSLLYLSGGIAFIGLALYLTHASEGKGH
ncbi:MAG: YqhA family protein [Gammaproteobacteria bacterium]|nr:YqhA family protein [Gammaproteobacteria bacterium]